MKIYAILQYVLITNVRPWVLRIKNGYACKNMKKERHKGGELNELKLQHLLCCRISHHEKLISISALYMYKYPW